MAVTYFGVDVGGMLPADVSVDTSTTSSDIELAVDDSNLSAASADAIGKIIVGLEAIRLRVLERDY